MTLLSKILFIVTVTLTFDLMSPKIGYTELKLLCGNLCGHLPAIPTSLTKSHNTARLETGV